MTKFFSTRREMPSIEITLGRAGSGKLTLRGTLLTQEEADEMIASLVAMKPLLRAPGVTEEAMPLPEPPEAQNAPNVESQNQC